MRVSRSYIRHRCDITLSDHELLGISCNEDALSFRFSSPQRIATAEVVRTPKMVRALTMKCAGKHMRQPRNAYDAVLREMPTWTAADLARFAVTKSGIAFMITIHVLAMVVDKTRADTHICDVPFGSLGLARSTLAKPAVATP